MKISVQVSINSTFNDFDCDVNYSLFSRMAILYPDFAIHFVTDKTQNNSIIADATITFQTIGSAIKNKITAIIWYQLTLSRFLKKNKPDVFVSSSCFCNLKHSSKQIIRISNDEFLKKSNTRRFIKAAYVIIVPNKYIFDLLVNKFPESANKTMLVPLFLHQKKAEFNFSQQEKVRQDLSDGKDYFLLLAEHVEEKKIISALKSFSFFKKWQKSNMKLLIVADQKNKASLLLLLETYKYKDDVTLIPSENKTSACLAAYACIFISDKQKTDCLMGDCMQAKIPMIMHDNEYNKSTFQDAVLYSKNDEKELSQKMILLYKDEVFRNELTSVAYNEIMKYNLDETCEKICNAITHPIV